MLDINKRSIFNGVYNLMTLGGRGPLSNQLCVGLLIRLYSSPDLIPKSPSSSNFEIECPWKAWRNFSLDKVVCMSSSDALQNVLVDGE